MALLAIGLGLAEIFEASWTAVEVAEFASSVGSAWAFAADPLAASLTVAGEAGVSALTEAGIVETGGLVSAIGETSAQAGLYGMGMGEAIGTAAGGEFGGIVGSELGLGIGRLAPYSAAAHGFTYGLAGVTGKRPRDLPIGPDGPGKRPFVPDIPGVKRRRRHRTTDENIHGGDIEGTFPGDDFVQISSHDHTKRIALNIGTLGTMNKQWPKVKKTTVRYSTPFEITPPGTSHLSGACFIKCNSMQNPGSGVDPTDDHEPMGWNQLSAIYEKYAVSEARIRVDYHLDEKSGDQAQATIDSCIVGLSLKDDETPLTTVGHYEELDGSIWHSVGPEGTGRLTYTVKPNRFFGVPDGHIRTDSTYRSEVGTEPTNILRWHLWCHTMGATTTSPSVNGVITVEYDVQFFEPTALAQS